LIPFLDVFDRQFEQPGHNSFIDEPGQVTLFAARAGKEGTQRTIGIFGHHDGPTDIAHLYASLRSICDYIRLYAYEQRDREIASLIAIFPVTHP
jgi:hypothetical protein